MNLFIYTVFEWIVTFVPMDIERYDDTIFIICATEEEATDTYDFYASYDQPGYSVELRLMWDPTPVDTIINLKSTFVMNAYLANHSTVYTMAYTKERTE